MKRLFLTGLLLAFTLDSVSYAKEVKVDCTMISNDVALFLQKTLQQVRRSSPPANACGVSVSIKVGHIDADLKNENYESDDMGITPIDFRNHFDFYFKDIKEHLSRSFKDKNLGISPKEIRNKNIYRFQAGAEHNYVSPAGTVVIARDFNKKTYQTPKEHWGVDEPEDEDLKEDQSCDFSIFSNIVWVISEPKNEISGFVNNVDKNGKKEKLKKGEVEFKRLGPNNGSQTKFETKIKEGYYKTEPELPSGHYKVEFTEPEECAKVIEDNWIFTSGNMMTKSFDVTCEENNFYTVTTSEKINTKVKALENYRGISKDLKSYQEDKDTYYVYIDAENAKIVQYHVDAKSTRKLHREAYKLNMQSCQYEIETKDKLIKNMGGMDVLKSEDAGWGFEDDTKIYVNLPSSQKELLFSWGRLRESGHYSKTAKYKKKIPQIAKNIIGELTDMSIEFRHKSENSEMMEIFKSLYDYPGTSGHVKCGGKVSMETLLIPPLDPSQDPDVAFKINIRPSTKGEIKILKNKMNIK